MSKELEDLKTELEFIKINMETLVDRISNMSWEIDMRNQDREKETS